MTAELRASMPVPQDDGSSYATPGRRRMGWLGAWRAAASAARRACHVNSTLAAIDSTACGQGEAPPLRIQLVFKGSQQKANDMQRHMHTRSKRQPPMGGAHLV